MAEYDIPFVCLIFTTLIAIIFFTKKKVELEENYYYKNILIFTLLVNSTNFISHYLASIYAVNGITKEFSIVFSSINKLGCLFIVIITGNLFSYFLYICTDNYKKNFKRNNIISIICYLIIGILIFMLDFDVYKVSGITSGKGSSVILTYLLAFINVIGALLVAIVNIRKYDKRYNAVFFILPIILLLGLFVLFHPQFNIYDLILSLLCYLMYFTIENPDLKMIQELEVATDEAEKANRAKTDFLSSMSHEIRTPLNAIVGFSDCIADAKSLDDAKSNARDIVLASNTLLEIVNGILDISKIEAGKIDIVNSQYKAREVFIELAKLISPKMIEKGLDFTYYIAPDVPEYLYGDHANIKKIITNLLSNASKYTDKGFVRYEVNCINTIDVSKLIISVEDSGRGIRQENIDKLFTKFQRLDEDRNTTIEGTGLGLAITKQLVELMGGKIIVHTVYGEGSKFTVIINQKIEKNPIIDKNTYKTTLDLHNIKILIVDDNNLNLKVTKKLLEKYNANYVVTSDSGFNCIDRIKNGEVYDVILLDDMMPKMSGVVTLSKLKEINGFNTPVIALTANAITGMREKYLKDGFNDYLSKPIDKDDLVQVMNHVLNRSVTEDLDVIKDTPPVRDSVISVEDNKIIPVDENIDSELGSSLDLSPRDDNNMLSKESEEVLDNGDILPVVDIDVNVYDRSYLESNGVDVSHALELLGDMEMYNDTIKDFLTDADSRWESIVKYKDTSNMPEYAILVHSLKSDSKYLGFMKLADIAYQHELKSKAGDVGFINSHFNELETEYKRVLDIVRKYVSSLKET